MITCPKCGYENEEFALNCANCRVNLKWALENIEQFETKAREAEERAELEHLKASLIVTTTYSVEGRAIVQYLDVVTAEVVLGTGFLSELGAGLADFLGTRAESFQKKLREAKNAALRELRHQAVEMDADAIVGMALNYMTFANNLLMLSASGTAVKLAHSHSDTGTSSG
jgi:uncharacterized protein YbjQ (UPF0145 family)